MARASVPSLSRRSERSPGASSCTFPNLRTSRKITAGPASANSKRRCVCRSGSKRRCSSGASASAAARREQPHAPGAVREELARHAEVQQQPAAALDLRQQVLAHPLELAELAALETAPQPGRRREEEVGGARGVHPRHAPPDQERRDGAPRHLDLGQLGHAGRLGSSPDARTPPAPAAESRLSARLRRACRDPGGRAAGPAAQGKRPAAGRTSAAGCGRRRRRRRRAADGAATRGGPRARARARRAGAGSGARRRSGSGRGRPRCGRRGCRAGTPGSAPARGARRWARTAVRTGRRPPGRGRRGSARFRDRSRTRRRRRRGRTCGGEVIEPCGGSGRARACASWLARPARHLGPGQIGTSPIHPFELRSTSAPARARPSAHVGSTTTATCVGKVGVMATFGGHVRVRGEALSRGRRRSRASPSWRCARSSGGGASGRSSGRWSSAPAGANGAERVRVLRRAALRERAAALRASADRLREGHRAALPDDARPARRAALRLGLPRPARRARGREAARHLGPQGDPGLRHRPLQRLLPQLGAPLHRAVAGDVTRAGALGRLPARLQDHGPLLHGERAVGVQAPLGPGPALRGHARAALLVGGADAASRTSRRGSTTATASGRTRRSPCASSCWPAGGDEAAPSCGPGRPRRGRCPRTSRSPSGPSSSTRCSSRAGGA